jgi:hypothetical protein
LSTKELPRRDLIEQRGAPGTNLTQREVKDDSE